MSYITIFPKAIFCTVGQFKISNKIPIATITSKSYKYHYDVTILSSGCIIYFAT